MSKRTEIAENNENLLFLEPDYFDEAILGVVSRTDIEVLCYSTNKIIGLLVDNNGMSLEEALEYFYFNIHGAYLGEYTPVYLEDLYV